MKEKLKRFVAIAAEVIALVFGGCVTAATVMPCDDCKVQVTPAATSPGAPDAGVESEVAHG